MSVAEYFARQAELAAANAANAKKLDERRRAAALAEALEMAAPPAAAAAPKQVFQHLPASGSACVKKSIFEERSAFSFFPSFSFPWRSVLAPSPWQSAPSAKGWGKDGNEDKASGHEVRRE